MQPVTISGKCSTAGLSSPPSVPDIQGSATVAAARHVRRARSLRRGLSAGVDDGWRAAEMSDGRAGAGPTRRRWLPLPPLMLCRRVVTHRRRRARRPASHATCPPRRRPLLPPELSTFGRDLRRFYRAHWNPHRPSQPPKYDATLTSAAVTVVTAEAATHRQNCDLVDVRETTLATTTRRLATTRRLPADTQRRDVEFTTTVFSK